MKRTTLAGLGGIAFTVSTFIGVGLASPPGGTYKASNATNFVASGHRAAVFAAEYLALIGVLGLICLLARLRDVIDVAAVEKYSARHIYWGVSLAAAASFAIGWSIAFSPPIMYAVSAGGDPFSLPPAEIYAIDQAGNSVIFGSAGILLAFALIILFVGARAGLPDWLRWVTLVAGVLGLGSIAFFPWFALPLWSLITGIWLLASGGELATSPGAAQTTGK